MRIGIIDADLIDGGTKFPNLALMKISSFEKRKGNNVELIKYNQIGKFDKVYVSKVFDFTSVPDYIVNKNQQLLFDPYPNTEIVKGGTGFHFDKAPSLDDEIEHHKPDYGLYDEYVRPKIENGENKNKWKYYLDYDIGFTTRGCFRGCDFCVNRNKTKVCRHSQVEEFISEKNKYITLLDDNILGFGGWRKIIEKLMGTGKYFEYKQGMDMRLMTEEKAKILNEAKYHGDYIFAFDNLKYKDDLIPKIKIWNKYKSKQTMFYVLCGFKGQGVDNIVETFERIKILMDLNCIPYIMRHKRYNKSKYRGIYVSLARWCNQRSFFKKLSFREFCEKTAECGSKSSLRYMKKFEKEHPLIANKYFDIKY